MARLGAAENQERLRRPKRNAMVALGCHGSLGESGQCAGSRVLNITIAGTVRRAGGLQGPDDEMEGIEGFSRNISGLVLLLPKKRWGGSSGCGGHPEKWKIHWEWSCVEYIWRYIQMSDEKNIYIHTSLTKGDPEGGRGAIQYEGGMPLGFERGQKECGDSEEVSAALGVEIGGAGQPSNERKGRTGTGQRYLVDGGRAWRRTMCGSGVTRSRRYDVTACPKPKGAQVLLRHVDSFSPGLQTVGQVLVKEGKSASAESDQKQPFVNTDLWSAREDLGPGMDLEGVQSGQEPEGA
ncbi:hypothetical protein B0H13DRAFT_2288096 [Mycena leptocephala]|nr:hypothetical protein B0H13DRAFT_2288096 [Mycena leptocephala]